MSGPICPPDARRKSDNLKRLIISHGEAYEATRIHHGHWSCGGVATCGSRAGNGANPAREIQTLIDNHINGFNTQNIDFFLGVFGDTAIIIDGIAPYRWLNPNAPANWLADVERWRKDLGVSHEHLSYKMGFWNVEGSDAYAVIAGTLTVTIKGQTVARNGTLAYTFSKHGEGWKIDAQAWGRTS